jgi:glycosyltransferase involved in cell wall biosynthesis
MWANMELLMRRWRAVHEAELKEFDRRDDLGPLRDSGTREWTLPDARPKEPLDVLFVLPMMGVFGGVADVLELANALILEGVRTGVAVLGDIPREMEMELFFRPLRIAPGRFLDDLPATRLLVATSYQTAAPVAAAGAARGIQTAYFVQDYEGWFGGHGPEYVAKTYDLIPRMTAISTWLSKEIQARHGYTPAVVPMSADPELFYPRGDRASGPPWRVVAMLRPDERRGARTLLPVLQRVSRRSDVEVVLFGAHPVPPDAPPFPHRHAGVLSRDAVAALLSTAHVVIDPSLFQGFGLVGLEGMASGAACVLTDSGGIREYAEDGVNALVVPTRDESALGAAVERLLDEPALRERLAKAGVETARRFTWKGAAEKFLAFARSLPPPEPASEKERAALYLLWEESCRAPGREAELRGEIAALSARLHTIYRSTVWRFATSYWKLKAKVRKAS